MPPSLRSRSPATGRRERNKQEKLERIVQAAGELFRDQGFEATTSRQICERAGIATGTLFLYVRDKRELLFLFFRPRAEGVFARLPGGLREGEDVVDGLMALFGGLLRLYGADPPLARLFVAELLFRRDQAASMRELSSELATRVGHIVADGRARGQLRSDVDVEVLGHAMSAHYALFIQLWLGRGVIGRRKAERRLRQALELQLSGIAAGKRSVERMMK